MKLQLTKTLKSFIACLTLAALLSNCSNTKPKEERAKEPGSQLESKDNIVEIQHQSEPDTLKGSLAAQAIGKIGAANIKISYHSPAARGRIVWGGLVPFDKVWVTGAHMATSIEVDQDMLIGSTSIPSGKYAMFTIPGKEEWTIIINKNWQQHLTDEYDAKDDIVRMHIKPETEGIHQERLRYVIETESDTEGEIVIYWEKVEISLPIHITGTYEPY